MRTYNEPLRWHYSTEEEYLEELDAYEREMTMREDEYIEMRREQERTLN